MSEHQECYPLPVNCNMGKGRIEFADGELLCTMPPTCVNESWEYKRDLILNSVNNYDRLRKANEELAKALKGAIIKIEGECCSHRTEHGAENDSCYAQEEYHALKSSESDK